MERIRTANREIDKYGPGKDGFRQAIPGVSEPTYLSADFCNGLQESIVRVVERAGIVPANDFDQFGDAVGLLGAARALVELLTPNGASNVGYADTTFDQLMKNSIGKVVHSSAALMAIDEEKFTQAFVTGYYRAGDGGGGAFFFNLLSNAEVNYGTVYPSSRGIGRWILVRGGLVSQRQFGAVGNGDAPDGGADDTDALNRWTAYVLTAGAANQHALYGAGGIFRVSGNGWQIKVGDYLPPMITDGGEQFVIRGDIPVLVDFSTVGGSGQLPMCEWAGIRIDGIYDSRTNIGVRNRGVCFFTLKGWHFYNVAFAALAFNEKLGSFTEGWVLEDCVFDTSVRTWFRYSKSAGDDSFRSTGIRNYKGNLGAAAGPAIVIDEGCVPYLMPIGGTIWNYNPNGIFVQNNSTQVPALGDITIETQKSDENKLTLNGGNAGYIYHMGALAAWNFKSGKLIKGRWLRCREYFNASDVGQLFLPDNSSASIVSKEVGRVFLLPFQPGVPGSFQQSSAILTINVTAPGYFWQGTFMVMSGLTDNVINPAMLTSNLLLNTAGYGPMVVGQGTDFNIRVSNAATAIGTKCNYAFQFLHGLIPQM